VEVDKEKFMKCKESKKTSKLKQRAKQLKTDIPADVFAECREKSEDLWVDSKPKKWYYALPIVLVWLLLVLLIVKIIL
jgi:hypothetical protein